jgi:hypothetical protein
MRFTKLAAAAAVIAVGSTLASAADKPADKKEKVAPAAATAKPTDKGAQGGIILQNQGNKAADKGAQGGIILQNQGNKAANKGAQGGIILQNQGAKTPAGASKTATQKTTGATQ